MTVGIRKVSHGRGHSYEIDGKRADGVTTVINEGVPKPALINWAARETANYAVDHWDELEQVPISERYRRLERARFDGLSKAAARGTDVHALALAMALEPDVDHDIPVELIGHIDSYLKFTRDWEPEELIVEAVIANRQYRYAGTLDLVATLNDGATWLLDWKTTGKGVFPENALQLAAYRNATSYVGADSQEHDMPPVDRCGVVWLRADGYDLVPVQAGEREFKTFLHALGVTRWRKHHAEQTIGETLQPKGATR